MNACELICGLDWPEGEVRPDLRLGQEWPYIRFEIVGIIPPDFRNEGHFNIIVFFFIM